jgi:hypothetical protein
MKPPRVRFTIRRIMVAVAVVGIILAAWRLSADRRARADHHRHRRASSFTIADGGIVSRDDQGMIVSPEMSLWHAEMTLKYPRAACYPWLPVRPDPPEPE